MNNDPARRIATGWRSLRYLADNRTIPTWNLDNINVTTTRDPQNRAYFFVTLDDVPSRTNVWAHAADARTYFPSQDTPSGIASVSDAVDAKIEIVFPQGNAPVVQATRVNVSAMLFKPGTLLSVPPDSRFVVHLWRALNQGVGEDVGVGQMRLVSSAALTYPVWDWNDVDVSAARDPASKYFLRLTVDGAQTNSNVWAHGVDARTYFPQVDAPVGECE